MEAGKSLYDSHNLVYKVYYLKMKIMLVYLVIRIRVRRQNVFIRVRGIYFAVKLRMRTIF